MRKCNIFLVQYTIDYIDYIYFIIYIYNLIVTYCAYFYISLLDIICVLSFWVKQLMGFKISSRFWTKSFSKIPKWPGKTAQDRIICPGSWGSLGIVPTS